MTRLWRVLAVLGVATALATTGWTAPGLAQGVSSAPTVQSAPGPLVTESGVCTPSKVKFVHTDVSASKTTDAPAKVPGMAVPLTISGSTPSCLEVEFSALLLLPAGVRIGVSLAIDGGAATPYFIFATGQESGDYLREAVFRRKLPMGETGESLSDLERRALDAVDSIAKVLDEDGRVLGSERATLEGTRSSFEES